ncbi:MAG: sigma-54-dependent Fis family transcriptional regulator [Thermodesulfobacteriota bacterium]
MTTNDLGSFFASVGLLVEPAYVAEGACIRAANDALAHLLGYRREELTGRPLADIAPAAHQEVVVRTQAAGEDVEGFRTHAIHRTGALIDVVLGLQPVEMPNGRAVQVAFKKACMLSLPETVTAAEARADVERVSAELARAREETQRLALHKEQLLGAMREMVFLISQDHVIEYMNPSAQAAFGPMRGQLCHVALHGQAEPCPEPCPLTLIDSEARGAELVETCLGDRDVEYSAVRFEGYRGDVLALVVMRDVTKRKQMEREIEAFNSNLEEVIQKKISQLKESESIRLQLAQEVNVLRSQLDAEGEQDGLIGNSSAIREIREIARNLAATDATVLITGESGTGKELVANLIHRNSTRRDRVFLKFNCAAVSESLLESDLFGYERGAFTGATARRKGKFEFADGGSIFLDEIGDISPRMQVALLRVLQNGEIQRVGSSETVLVDVRVIASTNANLPVKVMRNEFREDLYYRLNIINIHLPPLRDRKDDIVPLASHFVRKYRKDFSKNIDFVPMEVINRLLAYDWPGNIRELENVIQRALILARGSTLTERDLVFSPPPSAAASRPAVQMDDSELLSRPLKTSLGELEKRILTAAITKCSGRVHTAAEMLGIGKTVLYDKLKRYSVKW